MKVRRILRQFWISLVGCVFSLVGFILPGKAAVQPKDAGVPDLEPKKRFAGLERKQLKAHDIAFEDAAGTKNRGAISQEPDGRFRGVIAQAGGKTREVLESSPPNKDKSVVMPLDAGPAPKDKSVVMPLDAGPAPKDKLLYSTEPATRDKATMPQTLPDAGQDKGQTMPPPPPKVVVDHDWAPPKSPLPAVQAPMPPGKDKEHRESASPPGKEKVIAFIEDPAAKDKTVGSPAGQEKGLYVEPPPPKGKLPAEGVPAKNDLLPAVQAPHKDKGINCESAPFRRDEAIDQQLLSPQQQGNPPASTPGPSHTPAPGPQSMRPGADYSLLLTQEQKDHIVMGTRDRLWTLNAEGKLERCLAGGARALMQEGGRVEVYDAEGHLLTVYQDIRAERIDGATRITDRMKKVVQKMEG